ncbi:MAG: YrhB domain-containing protein, partial [Candidatus Acidiferrum sp.]
TTMNGQPAGPINKGQALEIARKTIATLKPGTELVILEEKTVEKDFGWVFFFTTKKYLQTHNPSDLLPGNSPLVVERADGSTHFLSTSVPPKKAIEEYESSWRKKKAGSE